jgi:hypothetical protein
MCQVLRWLGGALASSGRSCVRFSPISPAPHRRQRLRVAIELGSVMLSEDGGESFSGSSAARR